MSYRRKRNKPWTVCANPPPCFSVVTLRTRTPPPAPPPKENPPSKNPQRHSDVSRGTGVVLPLNPLSSLSHPELPYPSLFLPHLNFLQARMEREHQAAQEAKALREAAKEAKDKAKAAKAAARRNASAATEAAAARVSWSSSIGSNRGFACRCCRCCRRRLVATVCRGNQAGVA